MIFEHLNGVNCQIITPKKNLIPYSLWSCKEIENEKELFNLQCWALTCQSFFSKDEWIWIFDEFGYKGDYEFIYF